MPDLSGQGERLDHLCFEDELFHHRSSYFSAYLLVHDEGKPGDEHGKQYSG